MNQKADIIFAIIIIACIWAIVIIDDRKIQKMRDEIESLKASNEQVWKVFHENKEADRVKNNLGLIPTEKQKQSKIKY